MTKTNEKSVDMTRPLWGMSGLAFFPSGGAGPQVLTSTGRAGKAP